MAPRSDEQDMRIPVFALDNPIRRRLDNQYKYCDYVKPGQVVADLGCGPGFFTIPLAKKVGAGGLVYAVDSDAKPIRTVEKKIVKYKLVNIQAHHASAADLNFIPDQSVDFVLADGLICTMAPRAHLQAVAEIKRIMKVEGCGFLVTGRGSMSYVDDQEWEAILAEFVVINRNYEPYRGDRWAQVKNKSETTNPQ